MKYTKKRKGLPTKNKKKHPEPSKKELRSARNKTAQDVSASEQPTPVAAQAKQMPIQETALTRHTVRILPDIDPAPIEETTYRLLPEASRWSAPYMKALKKADISILAATMSDEAPLFGLTPVCFVLAVPKNGSPKGNGKQVTLKINPLGGYELLLPETPDVQTLKLVKAIKEAVVPLQLRRLTYPSTPAVGRRPLAEATLQAAKA